MEQLKGPWKAVPTGLSRSGLPEHEIHWSDKGECVAEIVHGKEAARLISAALELLEACERLMDIHCPLTGNPSREQLVAFWEYEKTQGRGEADDQLFALAAISKATESP